MNPYVCICIDLDCGLWCCFYLWAVAVKSDSRFWFCWLLVSRRREGDSAWISDKILVHLLYWCWSHPETLGQNLFAPVASSEPLVNHWLQTEIMTAWAHPVDLFKHFWRHTAVKLIISPHFFFHDFCFHLYILCVFIISPSCLIKGTMA